MNKWFGRAVGRFRVAGGVLLVGAGAAAGSLGASSPDSVVPQLWPVSASTVVLPPLPDAPMDDVLMPGVALELIRQVPDTLRPAVDGPNMIGDDFVDQTPYAGLSPLAALDSLPSLDGLNR
jgi:hypothetical protein